MPLLLTPVLEAAGAPLLATSASYYWHLPVLLVAVSLVYSATRYDDWGLIWREALRWGLRLALFLAAIIVLLFALATYIN